MRYLRRSFFLLLYSCCFFLVSACSDGGYLLQCVKGQWDILSRARPIDDIIEQGDESQSVRDQLTRVSEMREFAVSALHLPDTGSYRKYVDLERPYVVWNLVAAPEFSLDLKQWCFPVVGCVSYRGYFDEEAANNLAKQFAEQGYDVDVYGVKAYSTLNWFDDPVLSTFLANNEIRLAALLFHEMAHQVIYVQNDTAFNESFAKAVERQGLRSWLQNSASADLWDEYLLQEARSADFHELLAKVRADLRQLYASELDVSEKGFAKENILKHAYVEYAQLKVVWDGYAGFDPWMQRGLNNARLSSMATYNDLVPAFEALLRQNDHDLKKFYAEVIILGALPEQERHAKLQSFFTGHIVAREGTAVD